MIILSITVGVFILKSTQLKTLIGSKKINFLTGKFESKIL
jgi:hypothetical protein